MSKPKLIPRQIKVATSKLEKERREQRKIRTAQMRKLRIKERGPWMTFIDTHGLSDDNEYQCLANLIEYSQDWQSVNEEARSHFVSRLNGNQFDTFWYIGSYIQSIAGAHVADQVMQMYNDGLSIDEIMEELTYSHIQSSQIDHADTIMQIALVTEMNKVRAEFIETIKFYQDK